MRKIFQLCSIFALTLLFLNASAQKQNSITVSGLYAFFPPSKMEGTGYSVAFQRTINSAYFVKAKYGYAQGWRELLAPTVQVENYEMFPLHQNHAGFHLTVQPGYRLNISKIVQFNFSLGPSVSYQSSLKELTNYIYSPIKYNYTNINQVFQEGLFFGGAADLSMAFLLNEKWSILIEGSAMGYFKAQAVVNTGIGIQYSF